MWQHAVIYIIFMAVYNVNHFPLCRTKQTEKSNRVSCYCYYFVVLSLSLQDVDTASYATKCIWFCKYTILIMCIGPFWR